MFIFIKIKHFWLLIFFFGVFFSLSFIYKQKPSKEVKAPFASYKGRQLPPSIPYEECSWKSKEYTQRLTQGHLTSNRKTEATSPCINCRAQTSYQGTSRRGMNPLLFNEENKKENMGSIPPICFFVHMIRSEESSSTGDLEKQQFVYCEDPNSFNEPNSLMVFDQCNYRKEECHLTTKSDARTGRIRNLYSRRFCLNEDYLRLTIESFNKVADCFGYSSEDKEHMFKLISHESYFILNKRGGTGDACYGQVTSTVHHDLTRYIFFQDLVPEWVEEYNIYKNAINKKGCEFLAQKVVHFPGLPEKSWKTDAQGNKFLSTRVDRFDDLYKSGNYSMFCRLTHDPYSCFLYSLYNYKVNELEFNEESQGHDGIAISEKLMRDFHGPIRHNEMIVFRGDIIKDDGSVTPNIELMFYGHEEVRHYFVDEGYSYSKDSQIYKVSLFPEDILRKDVVSRSYQGGKGIITFYWPNFMTSLKKGISAVSKDYEGENEDLQAYSEYRKILISSSALLKEKEGFLKAVDLDREFTKYLADPRQDRPRTSRYVSNMEAGVCYYQGNYIQTLLKNRYNVTPKDAKNIARYVQDNCPSRRFETPCTTKDKK